MATPPRSTDRSPGRPTDGSPPLSPDSGWVPGDEHDTLAEVDAAFRTQRRIALGYFVIFLVVILAVPGLTLVLDWWWQGRVVGGMSPSFLMAAVGLYLCFFGLALAAATLATAVEDRMLGGAEHDDREPDLR